MHEVRFVQKDGVAHESNFIIKKVMIRHLLGRPCWILTNYKRSQKRPAGQLCGSAHPISSLWSISYYVICITIENRIFRDERWHLTLTLTSDHKNNARNEFLRSGLYENMVLHMNLALLLKI